MDKITASFFYENSISFNVADSSSFACKTFPKHSPIGLILQLLKSLSSLLKQQNGGRDSGYRRTQDVQVRLG